MFVHAEIVHTSGMDRVVLLALLVSAVVAVVFVLRRAPTPPPEAPPNILRIDLDDRDR